MAFPWFAAGGDGLQVRRVDANTLNKQFRTTDRGWFSGFDVGQRLKIRYYKKTYYEILHRDSDLDRHMQWKKDMGLGTWGMGHMVLM
jgi:hypothetical protein